MMVCGVCIPGHYMQTEGLLVHPTLVILWNSNRYSNTGDGISALQPSPAKSDASDRTM